MRRHAVFRRAVHFKCADLHFKQDAGRVDHRGMQRLIHVGFRHGDKILKPAGDGLIQRVDHAQRGIAVSHGVYDDAHGHQIVNFVWLSALVYHLFIDGIHMLFPAFDFAFDAHLA